MSATNTLAEPELRHPIAVVAERTGLSQDVLRVWERRYGVVAPLRDPAGLRLYTDQDVHRLALIQAAMRGGRSISRVAKLSTNALELLIAEDDIARKARVPIPSSAYDPEDVVAASLSLARTLDAAALDEALRRAAVVMGMPAFLETVAAPLLRRVGDEWHAGRLSPAHEHLVTSSLHDIVMAMMRAFTNRAGARTVLVATVAGERHVIGASLVGAAAALEGWNVVYLGGNLPTSELASSAIAANARLVAVSIVYVEDSESVIREMRELRERIPGDITLLAGGAGAAMLSKELSAIGVRVESTVSGLLSELRADRNTE
ncbi:MAG: cobalamin-dependent protein [Gemmatimonadota bacterium]|nr:cobalamin-dependent protein [Gemmatimonadota bacterium]